MESAGALPLLYKLYLRSKDDWPEAFRPGFYNRAHYDAFTALAALFSLPGATDCFDADAV